MLKIRLRNGHYDFVVKYTVLLDFLGYIVSLSVAEYGVYISN